MEFATPLPKGQKLATANKFTISCTQALSSACSTNPYLAMMPYRNGTGCGMVRDGQTIAKQCCDGQTIAKNSFRFVNQWLICLKNCGHCEQLVHPGKILYNSSNH